MVSFILGTAIDNFDKPLIEKFNNTKKNEIILIVPEQYSFSAEKNIYSLFQNSNKKINVFSFSRLAHYIFKNYGGLAGEYADALSKITIMNLILYELRDKLKIYSKSINKPGFAETLLTTIEEIKNNGLSPADFYLKINLINDDNLKLKSDDFLKIFEAYNAHLNASYRDPLDDLARANKICTENDFFLDKEIYFDKFLSFSGAQLNFIKTMISQTDISFALYYKKDDQLFETTKNTMDKITSIANLNNVKINYPIFIKDKVNKPLSLIELEKNILRIKKQDAKTIKQTPDNIKVFIAPNEYDEVNCVLSEVISLVQKGMNLSDIVILTRNLKDYKNALLSTLKKYNIPYFIDEISSAEQMQLINLCYSIIDLANNFTIESCLQILKSDLTCFNTEEISIFENYLYTWKIDFKTIRQPFINNPRGFIPQNNKKPQDDSNLQTAQKVRELLIKAIDLLKSSKNNAKSISNNILKSLDILGVKKRIQEEILINDSPLSQEYDIRKQWDILIHILETIVHITKDIEISIKEYMFLFLGAIKNIDVGQIPQSLNCLLIGSAERTITNNPKATFIIGANDGIFPYISNFTGIFSNNDRVKLENVGINLSKTLMEKDAEERLIAYKALCSSFEYLYVCARTSDVSGNTIYPSEVIADLTKIYGNDIVNYTENRNIISYCLTDNSAFMQLAYHYNDNTKESESLKAYFNSNSNYSKQIADIEKNNDVSYIKLKDSNLCRSIFPKTISPSQIEQFYRCPFSYYCKYGLKIKPRVKTDLDSPSIGLIVHYILEKVVSDDHFLNMSSDKINEKIKSELKNYLINQFSGEIGKSARFMQIYSNLEKTLNELCNNIKQELMSSKYRPVKFEYDISNNSKVSELTVKIDDKNIVKVGGKVDRIDTWVIDGKTYLRIIDYKTGNKSIDFADLYQGLNLQMLIYLFSIYINGKAEFGDIIPAGILYIPAFGNMKKYVVSSRNPDKNQVRDIIQKGFRSNGLLLDSIENIKAMEKIEPGGTGNFIPIRISKDNIIYKKDSDKMLVSKFQLDSLFLFVENQIKKMYRSLLKGMIDQAPVAMSKGASIACDYCDYKSICNSDNLKLNPNITKLTKDEFFNMLAREINEKI